MEPEFPKFEDEPRRWVFAMIEMLMRPGVPLDRKDRERIVRQREILQTEVDRTPGGTIRDMLLRMARRYNLAQKQRHVTALRRARRAEVAQAQAVLVPARHALGAPIPAPPKLRRPVAALGGSDSETWDPSVAGL